MTSTTIVSVHARQILDSRGRPTVAWGLAIAAYTVFAAVSVQKVMAGAKSCGCFGPAAVDPVKLASAANPAVGVVALGGAATIAGVVRDTSGAVLPGVTVEAASPALIEKAHEVLTRHVEKIGRLLRGDLPANGYDGDRVAASRSQPRPR